jgi:hypothetical protein
VLVNLHLNLRESARKVGFFFLSLLVNAKRACTRKKRESKRERTKKTKKARSVVQKQVKTDEQKERKEKEKAERGKIFITVI